MSDPRVQQLLLEILDSEITPEEACRDCPELLSEVRQGLTHLARVAAEVKLHPIIQWGKQCFLIDDLLNCLRGGLGTEWRPARQQFVQQRAKCVNPKASIPRIDMRTLQLRLMNLDAALEAWRMTLERNPAGYEAWDGYAELALYRGKEHEYRRACACLLERFGTTTDPRMAEKIGRACVLLKPASEVMLRKAAALIDAAVSGERLKPSELHSQILFAKALAEYRQGRFDSALSNLQGDASPVLGPAPGLVRAMAETGLNRNSDAQRTLAGAIAGFDWTPAKAGDREAWMYHVLRREAERIVQTGQNVAPTN